MLTVDSNMMVDIETLSTKSDAVILAIAAVYFNPETGEIGDQFYTNINLNSNLCGDRDVSASTLIWWMQQEKEAQDAVFSLNHTMPKLSDALKQFSEFFKTDTICVWGNGSTFDITILETAFDKCRMDYPWKFWNVRDVRTCVELGRLVGVDPKKDMPFKGVKHNALDDSKHQAKYVSYIWQSIKALSEDI